MKLQQIQNALSRHQSHVIQRDGRAQAAVTIILEERVDGVKVLFIERSTSERDPWSGHIGFPGGKVESSDRCLRDAAEREAMEELGIELCQSQYLGRISDVAPGGLGIVVSGFVYAVDGTPDFQLDPHEVARIFWMPLIEMTNPLRRCCVELKRHDRVRHYPALELFEENTKPVWGITYRMLRNLFKAITPVNSKNTAEIAPAGPELRRKTFSE